MKNYYDKVLFLLALIVLGIGAGIYFQKGGLEHPHSIPAVALTGKAYEAIPAPKVPDLNPSWPLPPDQGEDSPYGDIGVGWVYYPFTPPKIYWDKDIGFTAQPPGPVIPPHLQPFGMVFVRAQEELYRVQFLGTGGTGERDDEVLLSDEENDESGFHLSLKSDQDAESKEHQIKLIDLAFTMETDHGLETKVATIKILDERTNQEVTLVKGKLYSPSGNRYWILHTEDPLPSEDWRVTAIGDKKEFPGDLLGFPGTITYEVTAVDFETPSVTVLRRSLNKKKLEVTKAYVLPTEYNGLPPPGATPAAGPSSPKSAAKPSAAAAPAAGAK